jgi:hypothetical protein
VKRAAIVVVAALVLAGCGSISAQKATSNWLSQANFHSNTLRLARDASEVRRLLAATSSTAADLHTVCGVLLVDAEAANSSLPSPDHQANTLLASAYESLGAASNTCYNAYKNPADRVRATGYLDRAVTLLTEAQIRLRVAAGATP